MYNYPVVIVTGASRGIGAAIARWLATQHAGVTIVARSADTLTEVATDVERLGGEVLTLPTDISDVDMCRRIVMETLQRFGRLDALVNNAATLQPIARLTGADPAAWKYTVEVNLLGPFYLMHHAIPLLRARQGRIINVSTNVATRPRRGWSAYCASKAGLRHLTRVAALEETEVTIMSVRPGVVDTRMQIEILQAEPNAMPAARKARVRRLQQTGQLEPPTVPARAIAWLALYAPREWHGELIDYDETRVMEPARSVFGEYLDARDGTIIG